MAKKKAVEQMMANVENAVKTASRPSELKITDIRTATVASNYDYPIIRIDTNQGVYGIGEVRDAGHRENALQFKSMLLGQNPCNVDMLFRTFKHFSTNGRESGGVSGIEIALWDLIGKVYGVPCYQFFGGKYRDLVRVYADTPTPEEQTPEAYAARVLERKKMSIGLTFIKFDIGPKILSAGEEVFIGSPTKGEYPYAMRRRAPGSGFGQRITDKGIALMAEVAKAVREAVGWETSLCIDHFGHGYMTAKEVIRLGKALEPYGLGWMEDPMPDSDIEGHRLVTRAINVPTAAGENLYLLEGFKEMIDTRAVDIIHPDLLTSGGMLETKRIADYAEAHGIPTALHFAGSPIACMANVHCGAAISSLVALENHAFDLPFWSSLVTGMDDPLIEGGYIRVPEKPGLGVDLNYEGIKENLRAPSGLFEPTDEWNTPKLGFWQPDKRWDK
jgi:L-alanine-DL-glutamate epimerase-like enolase superfamily enzyme